MPTKTAETLEGKGFQRFVKHAFLSSHQGPEFWIKKDDLMLIWGGNYQNPDYFIQDFKRRVLKPLKNIGFVTNVIEKKTALGITYNRRK